MKIILNQDIDALGKTGEVVTVKDGFARNYLFPKEMAVRATAKNVNTMQITLNQKAEKEAKTRINLQALAEKLNKLTLKFTLKAGEDEKLFGSVTSQMITETIISRGFDIDKKEVDITEPIKHVGNHYINVHLGHGLTGRVKIKVKAE